MSLWKGQLIGQETAAQGVTLLLTRARTNQLSILIIYSDAHRMLLLTYKRDTKCKHVHLFVGQYHQDPTTRELQKKTLEEMAFPALSLYFSRDQASVMRGLLPTAILLC